MDRYVNIELSSLLTKLAAVDVNIYASDPKAARALVGNHENTEVGHFLSDYLDLDLEPITAELRENGAAFDTLQKDGSKVSWMGKPLSTNKNLEDTDHYHGDFKRSLECGHEH